jgi:hypothetical protein
VSLQGLGLWVTKGGADPLLTPRLGVGFSFDTKASKGKGIYAIVLIRQLGGIVTWGYCCHAQLGGISSCPHLRVAVRLLRLAVGAAHGTHLQLLPRRQDGPHGDAGVFPVAEAAALAAPAAGE